MIEFHPDVEKEVLASYSWYEKTVTRTWGGFPFGT
jgi:hypothetical protein